MSLKETLMNDLKTAMKEKDTIAKNAVTMVRAAILQIEKDKKIELDDEGVLDVIAKQVKQRKDSLEEFVKGGRDDLVDVTKKELDILMKYLPKQLTKEELTSIVKEAIDKLHITEMKEMGKVMGEVMPKVKGKADGKAINEIVKELLAK
ncbi:MAG: GatB/YqeY domain-containing protein [Anaerofustis sp.]